MNKRVLKYGLVGVLGTLVHWGTLIALVEGLRVDPVLGSTVGFILTLILSFYLNLRWTFALPSGEGRMSNRFVKYSVISLIGLLLNSGIMYVAVHLLMWPYLGGQVVALLVVPLSNYLLHARWTFK